MMRFLAIPSLRWRLVAVMCLAYVAVSIATSVASYQVQESNLRQQLLRQAKSDARLLAAASIGPLSGTGSSNYLRIQLQDALGSLTLQSEGVTYAFVAASNNEVVASIGNGHPPRLSGFPREQLKLLAGGRIESIRPVIQGTVLGYAGVVISDRRVHNDLQHSLRVDLALRGLGLMIFILLSLVIARYILGPLAVMARAAGALRQGRLSARVRVHEGTELSTVAEAFNNMATALEQRIVHLSFLAEAGATLPNMFRESGDLTRVLLEFCDHFNVFGVCLTYPGDDDETMHNVYFGRDSNNTAWRDHALRYAPEVLVPIAGSDDEYAVMAVPVAAGGRFVTAREASEEFTPEEQQVISNFAYQIGIAADNARLFEGQQEALRVKDQFLSIVSHELRTPLTTIKGYAQMLKFKLAADEDGLRFADTIDAQVGRLSRLVDDLLDVTRFARGQFELKPEPTDIAPVLEDVVARFRLVAPEHTLRLDLPEAIQPGEWDHDRLEQVMNNLVSNAIKYSPEGGEVVVSAYEMRDAVVVTVRDQGLGIPEADQAQLFERFFRGSAEGQDIKGMGLGLYVTRRIVEAHGGTIGVNSTFGQGSEFYFTLPLIPQPAVVE